ncbi:hypothetical protein MLD38_007789 [Melastoma candidum]|uniref:Uncharacterized protein n=1 Tax=Melastoma candidum TaxID=119954 RepID=A0ACB9RTK0_9MYRT|nr:hypothetical protein MLD38_007789 [Melastoma candidum]
MTSVKATVDLVTIDSSDDDNDDVREVRALGTQAGEVGGYSAPVVTPPPGFGGKSTPPHPKQSTVIEPPLTPVCRSFWKAGDYGVGVGTMIGAAPGMLEHARIHPKFLHSNATSHKWAFGAIAELMDNAVDEVRNGATFVKVDKIDIGKDKSPALLFQDDGSGMDPDGLRKCMSLGYSSKKTNSTIGQYGNGFKTSTMRLGADVIVFSRAIREGRATQSVGLLSYTFLRRTGQDDVIVPMIDFDISNHWAEPITSGSERSWLSNLKLILDWSPFASKDELLWQFEDLKSHGTKIIIYNLWLNDEGIYELSFDDDDKDIRLRDETHQQKLNQRNACLQSHISYRLRYSLRAYASVLYLRKFPNFQVILRGNPVEQYEIANSLLYIQVVTYRPQVASNTQVTMEATIGFMQEACDVGISGFNVYHKNRLIRPFWKVMHDGSSKGFGVIGVLEANFIEPAHDKQDFERSPLYIRLESRLKQMHSDYVRSHCNLYDHLRQHNINKVRKGLSGERFTGPSMQLNSPLVGRPDKITGAHQNVYSPGNHNVSSEVQVPIGHAGVSAVGGSDGVESMSYDQLCEENKKLLLRCEEHKQKEVELKEMISKVEKELEETRSKCASLSSHIESRSKQLLSVRPSGRT